MGTTISRIANDAIINVEEIREASKHLTRCINKWGHLTVGDYVEGHMESSGPFEDSLAHFYHQHGDDVIRAYIREKHSCEFLYPRQIAYIAIVQVASQQLPKQHLDSRWSYQNALAF